MENARFKRADKLPAPFFLSSARSAMVIAVLAVAALGMALYLRFAIIQNTALGLACEAELNTLTCSARLLVVEVFNHNIFGFAAIIAAVFQLWRPTLAAFSIGLVATLAGLVLYNTNASALAAALLVLSLARPAPAAPSRQAG